MTPRFIQEKQAITRWIQSNRNLVLLRNRLRKEIPRRYRKVFYDTWVFSHLGTRFRFKDAGPGELSPLTVKISPTMRCNLKCKGCFAGNYPIEDDMLLSVMEKIVSQAAALQVPSIGIIGGEPLLFPDIFELFGTFDKMGFYLVTNGLLVDDQTVAALQHLPHVVTIFSVEGFRETNDSLRGEGVFDKIMSAMKRMKEARLIFGFSTVVHKENLAEVISEEYIDYMIENGCFFGGFLPYIPVGQTPRYDVVCSGSQVRGYYRELDRITRSKPILILKEGYSDGTFLNRGCDAGHTIHLTSSGEAEPCNGIQFFTDTIHRSSMQEILDSDFFVDIRGLHRQNGRGCLTITQPEAVLEVVKKHRAQPTHFQALEHLQEYVSLRREV